MQSNNCHICKSETTFLLNKDGFSLFRCSACGLVYMNPLPQQNFLAKEVYSFESGYQSNKAKDLSKAIPDKKTRDILDYFARNKSGVKLLDVGCSSGEFMYHARKKGFDVSGVELNGRTADIGIQNGLNIVKGLLVDAHYSDEEFDIIFLGDIIEHVLSPRDFVLECLRILKRGGIVVISTPNLDCLWAETTFSLYKTFGIPWSSVTPPYHTFQFSISSLDELMKKLGFVKSTMWFYKPPRLMYELGSLHLLKKFKQEKTVKYFVFMIFSFALYTLSYATIVGTRFFRKKDFSMVSIYAK